MSPQQQQQQQRQKFAIDSSSRTGNRTTSSSSSTTVGYKKSCRLVDLSSYQDIRLADDDNNDTSRIPLVIAGAAVTMEQLVQTCLKMYGLVPRVVAEFRTITVGGAICGASLESSSHSYGQFMDAVAWIRVLQQPASSSSSSTDNKEEVSKKTSTIITTKRGDLLWRCLSGTYGTFGIVLEAAIECVRVNSSCYPYYLQVSYYCYRNESNDTSSSSSSSSSRSSSSRANGIRQVTHKLVETARCAKQKGEDIFLEGLQFPPEQVSGDGGCAVMMVGRIMPFPSSSSTSTPSSSSKVGWKAQSPGGPFYFEHVRDLVASHLLADNSIDGMNGDQPIFFEEWIELEDYLFRYDDGAFWMARPMAFQWSHVLSYLPFTLGMFAASHRLARYATGPLFTTARLFQALKLAPQAVVADKMIIQDFYMPNKDAAVNLVEYVRQEIPTLTTPIWLCPVRRPKYEQPFSPSSLSTTVPSSSSSSSSDEDNLIINCGIYGRVSDGNGRNYTQQLERLCQELGGRKMLYAQNFYNEATFWDIYNRNNADYDKLRHELNVQDCFPGLYEKTCCPLSEESPSWLKQKIGSMLL